MITINKQGNIKGDQVDYELKGLSSDEKPTNVGINSLFLELDTGDFYYFDGANWQKVGG